MKIILASGSPRRVELLRRIVADFEIKISQIEEQIDFQKSATENVERLATEKARAVFEPNSITIGGDTLGELEGKIFGKPKSKKEAVDFLKELSGKKHLVVSGFCLKTNQEEIIGRAETWVEFNQIPKDAIEQYVRENSVENFAAAYAIQDLPKNFVRKIEGELETVIGFPIKTIEEILKEKRFS